MAGVVDYEKDGVTCQYNTDTGTLMKGPTTSATTVVVPGTIDVGGQKYPITIIGKDAFKNNKDILEVVISEGITTIGESAFNGCDKLKKITLPSSLGKINNYAFQNCIHLVHISCRVKDPATLNPANLPANEMMTLYVPKDKRQLYIEDYVWSTQFIRIVRG